MSWHRQRRMKGLATVFILFMFLLAISAQVSAFAGYSAVQDGLNIYSKQVDGNTVQFGASNSANTTLVFSAKASYSYVSLIGTRAYGSKTISGMLTPGQMDDNLARISSPGVKVDSLIILSSYGP